MLEALDFSLHPFTRDECIEKAMSRLPRPAEPEPAMPEMPPLEQQPLKLQIDSNITRWEYGQLTPDATPPCSASPAVHLEDDAPPLGWRMPLLKFLPLL